MIMMSQKGEGEAGKKKKKGTQAFLDTESTNNKMLEADPN